MGVQQFALTLTSACNIADGTGAQLASPPGHGVGQQHKQQNIGNSGDPHQGGKLDRFNDLAGTSTSDSDFLQTNSSEDLSSDGAIDAAETGEAGRKTPVIYSHEWEHAIYEGRPVPEDHRCTT